MLFFRHPLHDDTPNDGTISGSVFFANGSKVYGIKISLTQGTGGFAITGSTFFGFNNLDYYAITLGSRTNGNLVSSNLFYSCTQLINDTRTNNLTEYAEPGICLVYNGPRAFQEGIFANSTSSLHRVNVDRPTNKNNLALTGAASGSSPILETFGNNANINLQIITKGTSAIKFAPANISMSSLPTTKPSTSGFLWNNSGVLNVS